MKFECFKKYVNTDFVSEFKTINQSLFYIIDLHLYFVNLVDLDASRMCFR